MQDFSSDEPAKKTREKVYLKEKGRNCSGGNGHQSIIQGYS